MKRQFLNQFHFLQVLQQTDFKDIHLESCTILVSVQKDLLHGCNAAHATPPREHVVDMWLRSCHSRSPPVLAHPTFPV